MRSSQKGRVLKMQKTKTISIEEKMSLTNVLLQALQKIPMCDSEKSTITELFNRFIMMKEGDKFEITGN
jgi:hypothetical protein